MREWIRACEGMTIEEWRYINGLVVQAQTCERGEGGGERTTARCRGHTRNRQPTVSVHHHMVVASVTCWYMSEEASRVAVEGRENVSPW